MLTAAKGALAQDYLLPNAPGKTVVIGACETCHGVMTVVTHKRSPHQWDQVIRQMIGIGASISEDQKKSVTAYLNTYFGQSKDYVPQPAPLRGPGPGILLALEAATTAQEFCRTEGHQVTTLVVDSVGTPIVLLMGDGVSTITQAIAATKTATVLRFKQSSGVVMKRLDSDPVLVALTKNDPEIGEVRQGGLPIVRRGELVGAIAVAGAFGPADTDEKCAQAGLDRIASRLH